MAIGLGILYGYFLLVALLNWILMRRPKPSAGSKAKLAILIPARNEAHNLAELLPLLTDQGAPVYVFDDESTDETGAVAQRLGARVVRPTEPLPTGWTGKNRACHQLALYAIEETDAEWLVYLDADTRPKSCFLDTMRSLAEEPGGRIPVITGFPQIRSGKGIEPLFLGWVGWILLATNPFGLVGRSGMGHNRFLNGQIQMWRTSRYAEIWPNERVKDKIMEDVQMGRDLARLKVPVEVSNLSDALSVRMYETWRETLDGMSKNSFEITGSYPGTAAVAALFLFAGWGWLLAGSGSLALLAALTLSGVVVARTVKASMLAALVMPLVLTLGAFTLLRSAWWRKTGRVVWKGRSYPG